MEGIKAPIFYGGSFSNRDNVRFLIQFEEKVNPSILNDDFSSRTDPSIFTSIQPLLLDQSKSTQNLKMNIYTTSTQNLKMNEKEKLPLNMLAKMIRL